MKKIFTLFAALLVAFISFAQVEEPEVSLNAGPVVSGNKAPKSQVTNNKNGKATFWYNLPDAIENYWGSAMSKSSFPIQCDTLNKYVYSNSVRCVQMNSFAQVYNFAAKSWEDLYLGQPAYDKQSIPLLGESTYSIDSVTFKYRYKRGTQVPDSVVDTLIVAYIVGLEKESRWSFSVEGVKAYCSYLFPYDLENCRTVLTYKDNKHDLTKGAVIYYDTLTFTTQDSSSQFLFRTFPVSKELQNIKSSVIAVTGTFVPGVNERTAFDTIGVTLNSFNIYAYAEERTDFLTYGSDELLTDYNMGLYVGGNTWNPGSSSYGSYMTNMNWESKPKFGMGIHVVCEDCPIVNIEDPEQQTVFVYPNPVTGNLKVNFVGEASIQLFNMVGQMVYSTKATDNATINVSNLRSGVYMLKVNNKTTKVIVR